MGPSRAHFYGGASIRREFRKALLRHWRRMNAAPDGSAQWIVTKGRRPAGRLPGHTAGQGARRGVCLRLR